MAAQEHPHRILFGLGPDRDLPGPGALRRQGWFQFLVHFHPAGVEFPVVAGELGALVAAPPQPLARRQVAPELEQEGQPVGR